jgi:CubicO group peptidase (beta-lactamase class C family)
MQDYADGPRVAFERICELKPLAEPGQKFVYSDVGFIVLGEVVRRVSGKNVHEFSQENLFRPLGMTETGYLPAEELRRRAAPTEKRDGQWLRGEVHDPRAFKLEGIAGHAGLFSTAEDLAVYAQMLLDRGEYAGVRVLKPETVELMTSPHTVPGGVRALGWDMRTRYSSNRGESFSPRAFGHGGFTGTTLWIDPELDLFVIFLSNRVHPDGKGLVNPLAGRIGTITADAIAKPADP